MVYLFLLTFLISGPLLLIGLIFPNFLFRLYKKRLTRKQNLLIYGILNLVSFVGFGLLAPEIEPKTAEFYEGPQEEIVETVVNEASITPEQSVTTDPSLTGVDLEEKKPELPEETYVVTRVIDGDTIDVLINGEVKRVRYIGINTPETVHPSKPVECFGLEASNKNKELVAGKQVRLVKDISETDKYGRLLRYVYVGDVFVNLTLVKEGYANASSYPPDVRFNEEFRQAEQVARQSEAGLWGSVCSNYTPEENTTAAAASQSNSAPAPSTADNNLCVVKGNINSDKVKIYHVPGCQSYNQTKITEETGERWFCSEQEALNAGWRKALNC